MILDYYNIINEMLGETEHAQLIECATVFVNIQDEVCSLSAPGDDRFIIKFESDGNVYTINGKIENGEVQFHGFYRKSDKFQDNIDISYLSPEGFKNALSTRNLYPLLIEKVLRLISNYKF